LQEVPILLILFNCSRRTTTIISCSEKKTAYGVACIIIKADLSKRGIAHQIYETTKKAGLKVDILINNAGICTTKDIIQT
jgi:short-subunit dehydrogenase